MRMYKIFLSGVIPWESLGNGKLRHCVTWPRLAVCIHISRAAPVHIAASIHVHVCSIPVYVDLRHFRQFECYVTTN